MFSTAMSQIPSPPTIHATHAHTHSHTQTHTHAHTHVYSPIHTRTQTYAHTDIVCTWSGQLPPRRHKNPTYSPRVFLGGVPWDITEAALLHTFQVFGNLTVDWPGKDNKHNRHPPKGMCVCVCVWMCVDVYRGRVSCGCSTESHYEETRNQIIGCCDFTAV